ncbi:hypothetical protein [Thioclava sp. GXIMD2076]|uniref:Chalcone isomerase domain-containing protein n=1 Tax=Thioclava kandeliae TaxID=3070818 RepID=A0ABV1SCX3_9RHOB
MVVQMPRMPRLDHLVLRLLASGGAVAPVGLDARHLPGRDMLTVQIGFEQAIALCGESPGMGRLLRSVIGAERVEISCFLLPANKAAYKERLVQRLVALEQDPALDAAIAKGRLRILTADEVPELNIQPTIRYRLLSGDGKIMGSGLYSPEGFDQALYDRWREGRWQRIIGKAYVYYEL